MPAVPTVEAPLQRIAALRAALQGPLWRAFGEPLESAFREHQNQSHLGQRRAGGVILVVMLATLIVADQWLLDHRMSTLVRAMFVLGIFVPIIVALALDVIGLVRVSSGKMALFHAWLGIAYLAILVQTGRYDDAHAPYTWEAYLILLASAYFFSGLRLWMACAVGFGMLLGYVVVESATGLATRPLTESALFLLGANVVGIIERFYGERLERSQWLSAQLLAEMAGRDPLTGLLNRRSLEVALDAALREARRNGQPLVLAVIDVDHFKAYNDTLGHAAGDELLIRIAGAIDTHGRRPLDAVARLGGDEFLCLWYGVEETQAQGFIAGVHASLQAQLRALVPANAPPVSISMGAVHRATSDATTARDLYALADAALYAAKRGGRARAALSAGAVGEARVLGGG